MAITKCTMYKTNDGKLFDSLDKAKNHVTDRVAEVLHKKLSGLLGRFSANDVFAIILHLCENYDKATELMNELNAVFDNIDIEGDNQ